MRWTINDTIAWICVLGIYMLPYGIENIIYVLILIAIAFAFMFFKFNEDNNDN